jgi:hypothetical protein
MARITKNPDDLAQLARKLKPEIQDELNRRAADFLRNARIRAACEGRKSFLTVASARAVVELFFFAEAFDG